MDILLSLISIIISICLTLYLKPRLIAMLGAMNLVAKNYTGKDVINGAGLVFLIPCIVAIFPLWKLVGEKNAVIYIALLLSMALVGYLDDSLGEGTTKGFKGHLRMILKGSLSTGIIKIIFALIMGITISMVYFTKAIDVIFNTILFSLCVNFINLLDLRPGRAIKGFAIIILLIAIFSSLQNLWIISPIISSIVIYLKDEFEEKCMLGDTGSNLLGGILGMYTLKTASIEIKYTLFFSLFLLHIAAEFWSFSKIIETVPIFRYMDSFGQLKKERP